jgi:Mn-dependent DtxR family transcriptional regulator
MEQKQPLIIQILQLIAETGPISPEKIRRKLKVEKRTTVHPLVSILRTLGLVKYYVDKQGEQWQGVYTITETGKEVLKNLTTKK